MKLYKIINILIVMVVCIIVMIHSAKINIVLALNGEEIELHTLSANVGEVIEKQGLEIKDKDFISHSMDALVYNGMKITVKEARVVTLIEGEKNIKKLITTKKNPIDILNEFDVITNKYDEIDTKINDEGKVISIIINKAKWVRLIDGSKERYVWTTMKTVKALLNEQKVKLGELDVVIKEDEIVENKDTIKIERIEKKEDVEIEYIDYKVISERDNGIQSGQEKIVNSGQKGKKIKYFEVIYKNGEQIKKTFIKEKVVKKPIHEVIAIGPIKAINASSKTSDVVLSEFYVESTAYTAYCVGCSGTTSEGIDLRENPDKKVIAVDPKVIPLGSKVWVEGYGDAIAADIGSAIKGYKIDVFIPTNKEALRWGRKKVKIKILK